MRSPHAAGAEYTFGTEWLELLQHSPLDARARGWIVPPGTTACLIVN